MKTVTLSELSTTAALATSVRQVMRMQQIAAITLFTASGTTARLLSKNRPACPILAFSSQPGVIRQACLYYGVVPRLLDLPASVESFLKQSESMAKSLHLATSGDRVIVLAAHPIGAAGGSKILIVEEIT
jgi:pyruvate kinase